LPAPGATIDSSNYKQYSQLFPEEWAQAFETGFDGLLPKFRMTVAETKSYPQPKQFLEYSAKNKGKYSMDTNGNITPVYDREGLPFPDLKAGDADFVTKLMWNYDSKYWCDEALDTGMGGSFEKRRGEEVRFNTATSFWLFFTNRMVLDPKPDLPNPLGLYKVLLFHYLKPPSIKNTITLSYRYIDQSKQDDTYLYLPSMRRVIRAEAGQRSTPILGSTQALDDFVAFDGRIPDFTYTLVREQKVLAVVDSHMTLEIANAAKKANAQDLPVDTLGYEVRDMYVIDVVPKDSKYPQSRKRIWVDKETLWTYYAVAWDRAGNVWKIWLQDTKSYPMPQGQQSVYTNGMIGCDLQFGMATLYVPDNKINSSNFTYNDVTPQALLKRAR
ncbi:MAG: DUF1329 domain-containing protein, partial [Pseudomonadota bacterium]